MPTIYIGGWARFRQECNVTKKEAFEDFSWMLRQESTFNGLTWSICHPADYEDCRDALKRVEGGTEYLKNYVPLEDSMNFCDPIGKQIKLAWHHSGASYSAMLFTYRALLNDWDGWVLRQKERRAYQEYQKIQVDPSVIVELWSNTDDLVAKRGRLAPNSEELLLLQSKAFGLTGTLEENHAILAQLYTEYMARMALENLQRQERAHSDLIEGLKWKYKHPIRWFDTPYGSTISPTTPGYITEDAFAEMERLYPGYRAHIQEIQAAMHHFSLPQGVTRYSKAGEEYTQTFLRSRGIIV